MTIRPLLRVGVLTKGDSNGYHLSFAANVRKIMVYSNIYSGFLHLDFGELLFFIFHFSLFHLNMYLCIAVISVG